MKSLRILLVINSLPFPFGNADARWYYVLFKGLVERGHQVTAFVACSEMDDIAKAQALFPASNYDLRYYPYTTATPKKGLIEKIKTLRQPHSYIFSSELRKDLATELAKRYDILHLEELWSGWLGLEHNEKTLINIHYLFSVDKSFEGGKSCEMRLREVMTNRAEKKLLKAFPKIITLSDSLAGHIHRINPDA